MAWNAMLGRDPKHTAILWRYRTTRKDRGRRGLQTYPAYLTSGKLEGEGDT